MAGEAHDMHPLNKHSIRHRNKQIQDNLHLDASGWTPGRQCLDALTPAPGHLRLGAWMPEPGHLHLDDSTWTP